MRKVVLGLGISLDGYIARPDGAVDFLFMPKDYSMGPFFATIDEAIMGRKTYEGGLKMAARSPSRRWLCTFSLTRKPQENVAASPSSTNPRKVSSKNSASAPEKTSG